MGTAFFGGAVLGLLICLPLVPYSLPESTANVVGAAFGALVAVWGAAWIADHKERQRDESAALAVIATVQPTLIHAMEAMAAIRSALEICRQGADRPRRVTAIQAAREAVEQVAATTERLDERLTFMVPLFLQLGGNGVMAHGWLATTGRHLRAYFGALTWGAYYDDANQFAHEFAELEGRIGTTHHRATRALQLLRFRGRPEGAPVGEGH